MTIDFETLIADQQAKIISIARTYTYGAEYEDLIQEILMQLWRSYQNFRGESKIETWVYRVAINTAITYQRSEIKTRKSKENNPAFHTEAFTTSGFSEEEILRKFVKDLNNIERAILMMYLDNFTSMEMESVLGIKANAIKVRISRLKKKFQQRFVD